MLSDVNAFESATFKKMKPRRIYGDTTVVAGRATPKGTINGKDIGASIRYSPV
jgi:hypothetical protein